MRTTRSGLRKISGSLLKGQLQKIAFLLKNSKKTNPDPITEIRIRTISNK